MSLKSSLSPMFSRKAEASTSAPSASTGLVAFALRFSSASFCCRSRPSSRLRARSAATASVRR
eukprot:1462494-Pleurochrysis_carterae.AAC.1